MYTYSLSLSLYIYIYICIYIHIYTHMQHMQHVVIITVIIIGDQVREARRAGVRRPSERRSLISITGDIAI